MTLDGFDSWDEAINEQAQKISRRILLKIEAHLKETMVSRWTRTKIGCNSRDANVIRFVLGTMAAVRELRDEFRRAASPVKELLDPFPQWRGRRDTLPAPQDYRRGLDRPRRKREKIPSSRSSLFGVVVSQG